MGAKDNGIVLHEASRIAFIMHNYEEAIDKLEKAAVIEGYKNAETYSDMARAIFMLGIPERNKD